ncbi:hypothetical protein J32TS6_25610 [Virgibacillus pantothenticus]|uniref:DUF6602 domain-containing protein n=1 Tax=Virgibacillus pantothenticus TaxID=1473 RepID=UPI001B0C358F|nr:DUF6602 domain-containing protein [Virgibacillus pantothenticus]GIP64006.1 hypothetical protein J32TS6_25610 [Virgibacillus pantothenticus]
METFDNLNEYYQRLSKTISSQLQLETPNHHVTSGTSRELIWLELFERLVPKKFKLARSVFIIDSDGHISAEVDIAIYDEQYTPYVFNYGEMQFIPIEAVAAAVQSKSRSMDQSILDNVTAWVETLRCLKPRTNSHIRTLKTQNDDSLSQTATRPIFILCTMHSLKNTKFLPDIKRTFDFILHLNEKDELNLITINEEKTLDDWYEELNHYDLKRYDAKYKELRELSKKSTEEAKTTRNLKDLQVELPRNLSNSEPVKQNPLLTFMFQLNQLLMIINNPMFFPHQAYVDMFNDAIKIHKKKECVKRMEASKHDFLLAVYDITGIQDYIFASNYLKENIGASYIVGKMVGKHLVDVLKDRVENNREVKTCWAKERDKIFIFDDDKIKAEVVYIGGGNALVIYRDWKLYNEVNRQFAETVLKESASLTMVTEAIPFRPDSRKSYVELYRELMKKLSDTKAKMMRTKLNQTLPIFAQESFKGDPITGFIDNKNVSTEQRLKRKAKHENTIFEDYEEHWVEETEDLKRKKGEDSYIGVVHIDGNGMGEWISDELAKTGDDFTSTIQKHRELSLQITKYFRTTFKEAFRETIDKFVKKTDGSTGKKEDKLPLRPLILDGDDVTFICQGDLAIPFTLEFLKQLKSGEYKEQISACSGVAFVHSHFPFNLAYDIAEQCCQNAKHVYYENKRKNDKDEIQECYFDFHLVRGSYVQTMEEQRDNQTYLDPKIYNVEELEELDEMMQRLNNDDEKTWPHSRLIALYEAYLQGKQAVELVNLEAESRGYVKIEVSDERLLFDALQLRDFGKNRGEEYAEV